MLNLLRIFLLVAATCLAVSSAMAIEVTAEQHKIMKKATGRLMMSDIVKSSIGEGDKAIDFTLPNAVGEEVTLSKLLEKGAVILTFYRGEWCPYCNMQMREFQEEMPAIDWYKATLVAVSPETPDHSLSLTEKLALTFEVLSDSGNKVAKKYGIVFKMGDDIAGVYKDFGIDLEKSQGNTDNELPIPATYVIKQDGTVVYAYKNVEYRQRADVEDIIDVLEKIRLDNL